MSMQPGQLRHVHIGGSPCSRLCTGSYLRLLNKGAEHLSQDELGSLLINLKIDILKIPDFLLLIILSLISQKIP